jgi:CRISPR system Cascade subunit CasB
MKVEESAFVKRLEGLKESKDRAALAKLRRGLGKKMGTPEMYPYIVPFLSSNEWQHENYFLIASLFAFHPEPSPRGWTMGTVFRHIAEGSESESVEKRFIHLMSADAEDIGEYLRHAISLAKSKRVGVDYHQLLSDLNFWDHPDRFVQLRWAKDFWGTTTPKNEKGEE